MANKLTTKIKKKAVSSKPKADKAGEKKTIKRRGRNKRSETTIQSILTAAEQVILETGAERVSILAVCEQAGISRGTFYRYYSSKEELLEAFSKHKRDRFHVSLKDALAPYTDPDERFEAMILYLDSYLEKSQARKLLLVAPEYAVGWFERIFYDSIVRFQDELKIVFDAWEERLGFEIDRELVCELMVRYILSDLLVSAGTRRKTLPLRITRLLQSLITGSSARR